MRRSFCAGILALALFAGLATSAAAQETGTPIFKAPYRSFENHEFGASLSDPGSGVSFAVEGFYRYGRGQNDFSLRGGFADVEGGDAAILIGGDFRTQVLSYSETFPLDGALTLGLGGIFGDGDDVFFLPVGISLGRRFEVEGSSTTFVPYVHPNIVPVFGGGDAVDDVQFTLGLGVDIKFSEQWAVRASGGLGDIEGVGVSVAYLR
ncbi:MAG: outer membrane beta-barrel protein [Gemmatimonadales bacterium]|nr:outer membrane beta-barrel protein [Gemmatimonadales bacterium]